jgi:PhzF family phenazine biosynthesis protein
MQAVAREMNLPETAFLVPEHDGFGLRWFTPRVEVELCGHATLASAHALWQQGYLGAGERARFFTKSGTLTAELNGDWIAMDFPEEPDQPAPAPPGLVEALGIRPRYVGKNRFDYVVEIGSEREVREIQPDFRRLTEVPARGIMVTAPADPGEFDFVGRFLPPAAGVDEDPVTGSAHCCLGPFWEKRLHKNEFLAHQVSERGGVLRVRTGGNQRVMICG